MGQVNLAQLEHVIEVLGGVHISCTLDCKGRSAMWWTATFDEDFEPIGADTLAGLVHLMFNML